MKSLFWGRCAVVLASMLGIAGTQAGTPPKLSITDVGQATGLERLISVDINNRGDVLTWRDADSRAYVWNADTGLLLVEAPNEYPAPMALNDAGVVVGLSAGFSGLGPFRWDAVNGFKQLKMDDGLTTGAITAINAIGQVAGTANGPAGKQRAIAGRSGGRLHQVQPTERGQSQAYAINGLGQIGGWLSTPDGCCESAALFERGGKLTLLGSLATPGQHEHGSVAALNDAGQAVGRSTAASGRPHAFVWSADKGMRDLHPLRGDRGRSSATAINRGGQVLIYAVFGERSAVFSWDEESGPVDLNDRLDPADPLASVTQVVAGGGVPRINDRRQIVADALVRGVRTIVLLTPLP